MELIKSEIERIKETIFNINQNKILDEQAFNYLIMQYFYYNGKSIENIYYDVKDMITDGSNDGGIDFVYYDDENSKVIVGQCKYTKSLKNNSIIEELNKMSTTVTNFQKGLTGSYNKNLKRELQNALDRLPEEDLGNVEYAIFTISELNEETLNNKIEKENNVYSKEMVSVFQIKNIISKVESTIIENVTVQESEVKIDKPKNMLKYETDKMQGVMVNITSTSLINIFNNYADRGLFDLNIRKYIRNKMVDTGIKKTIDSERDNFWFLNNGIIIACKEFYIDGNSIKLYDFSIVNGGQTTNLIGNYKGKNSELFYIPCKIVAEKKDNRNLDFFSKIAEATNSQKPILARDLKSNAPEMKKLKHWLKDEKIFLEIKRGENKPKKSVRFKIKNDELGQLILSFIYQRPGTSRSSKKAIFENNSIYNQLFKNNYEKDINKKNCIVDLIELNNRYSIIEEDIKKNYLKSHEKDIIKNGKQIIFALMGVLYNLANEDITEKDLVYDSKILKTHDFVFSKVISNYHEDDLGNILKYIIIDLVQIVTESYDKVANMNQVTSISNYFKTDKRYIEDIVADFTNIYSRTSLGNDLKKFGKIFVRG